MGTEILRPQDCLTERMRVNPSILPRRKPYYTGNSNRKPIIRSEPKKFVSDQSEPSVSKKFTSNDYVMGKVTILKRGESIEFKRKNENLMKKTSSLDRNLVVCVTEPLETDLKMFPKQIRVNDRRSEDVYAGSACFSSPSPRKLPLPTFSKKKGGFAIVDDSATKDLRRLLRLD